MRISLCVLVLFSVLPATNLVSGEPAPTPIPAPAQPPVKSDPSQKEPAGPVSKLAAPEIPADIREMTNIAYLVDLAQTHLNYGDTDRAEPLLRKALEQRDADPKQQTKTRAVTLLAQLLERKQDFKGAAEQYQLAVAGTQDPMEKARLILNSASTYERMNDLDKASEMLEQAGAIVKTSENPNAVWIKREIARRSIDNLRRSPAKIDAALKEAEAALAKNPKDDAAVERLAEIYTSVKLDNAKALQYYEQLAALRPNSPEVLLRLSSMYQQNKQPEKAIETSRKLMESAPKDQQPNYAYQVAMQMNYAGKKDEAIQFYESVVGKEPGNDRHAMLLASLYEQAGKSEQAEKMLKGAAANAKTPDEKANLLIRAAESARRRKDYAGAEQQFRAIYKEFKDSKMHRERARISLTQIYMEQGKKDELKLEN